MKLLRGLVTALGASIWFGLPAGAAGADSGGAYREFTDSCVKAFTASHREAANGREDVEAGEGERAARQMCECTAKESRHEKVPATVLRREAAKIRQNPKYEIRDRGLLNSFHYCTVEAMHEMEAAGKISH